MAFVITHVSVVMLQILLQAVILAILRQKIGFQLQFQVHVLAFKDIMMTELMFNAEFAIILAKPVQAD